MPSKRMRRNKLKELRGKKPSGERSKKDKKKSGKKSPSLLSVVGPPLALGFVAFVGNALLRALQNMGEYEPSSFNIPQQPLEPQEPFEEAIDLRPRADGSYALPERLEAPLCDEERGKR